MRNLVLTIAFAVVPVVAPAQTAQDLLKDHQTPGDVLINGMGYNAQRYSPLAEINRGSVKRLVPVWNTSLANMLGEEEQPLVYDGALYVTNHRSTYAINAQTGRVLWKDDLEYDAELPRVFCCGQVNRGPALYEGRLFRGTPDAHIQALDAKTGKELWKTMVMDWRDGYSMTGAPLVANGVLVSGVAGGEYGVRGFLLGLDPETGKELWRRHTIPGPGEPGNETWPDDSWQRGGATTWVAGSYDPALDLVYWGTGNAGPWNAGVRKGDNKHASSVIAVRPKTGEIVWTYQFTPSDPFDFDSVSQMILADIKVSGALRKVLMHADKNGFLYVMDRTNGKLIAGNPYVKVTWAQGLDANGRPILSASTRKLVDTGEEVETWPSITGGKNWNPMSFNPKTGFLYANTIDGGMLIRHTPVEYKSRGQRYIGVAIKRVWPEDGNRGALRALDPLTGKTKWEVPYPVPSYSGTLTTAGDLVFSGDMFGAFSAYDATNGTKLWSFQTGSGIVGQPITWEHAGVQYVTVVSGIGGVYAQNSGDERLRTVPAGGSVWTFALMK